MAWLAAISETTSHFDAFSLAQSVGCRIHGMRPFCLALSLCMFQLCFEWLILILFCCHSDIRHIGYQKTTQKYSRGLNWKFFPSPRIKKKSLQINLPGVLPDFPYPTFSNPQCYVENEIVLEIFGMAKLKINMQIWHFWHHPPPIDLPKQTKHDHLTGRKRLIQFIQSSWWRASGHMCCTSPLNCGERLGGEFMSPERSPPQPPHNIWALLNFVRILSLAVCRAAHHKLLQHKSFWHFWKTSNWKIRFTTHPKLSHAATPGFRTDDFPDSAGIGNLAENVSNYVVIGWCCHQSILGDLFQFYKLHGINSTLLYTGIQVGGFVCR